MMMLMLMRRVNEAHAAFQQQVIGEPVGMEAEGKVLGIIGLGKVGQRLSAAAKGLGMKVRGSHFPDLIIFALVACMSW